MSGAPLHLNHDLQKMFSEVRGADVGFLAALTAEDQARLHAYIVDLLENEGGALYSAMAMVSKMLPGFMRAQIAESMLGPKAVAKLSSYVPVPVAVDTAGRLKAPFLAEVAGYLKPDLAVEIIEQTPDRNLIDITLVMIARGQFELLAKFSDHLSARKLKVLAEKLPDTRDIIRIAREMGNLPRLVETALQFSDEYILRLMEGISHFEYYDIAAAVGQQMQMERQVRILKRLKSAEAARIASHYAPDIIAELSDKIETRIMIDIALNLEPRVLGECFNYFQPRILNTILPYLPGHLLIASLEYINFKKLETAWPEFSPEVQKLIGELAAKDEVLVKVLGRLIK